ncbi:uracil-DNA glycosylase family protein [Ferrimonas balearica]|nr:uracil-DNA glycosylase family protein [Ferrimonas balearica]
MVFDADIQFNAGAWSEFVQTQSELFDFYTLSAVSSRLREEFYNGHPSGREMPVIPRRSWHSDLIERYQSRPIGYDLPCLISKTTATRGRLLFCAQDPWRSRFGPSEVTVGTFFGVDNPKFRHNYRGHGAVWLLVQACVEAGYEVWLTDVLKLFVGKGKLWKDESLIRQCLSVLDAEIEVVRPEAVLAFGRVASGTLASRVADDRLASGIHPSYYGRKDWYLSRDVGPYPVNAEQRRKAKAAYYWRQLFGSTVPQSLRFE